MLLTLSRFTKSIVMALVPLITALGLWQQTGKVDAAEISLLERLSERESPTFEVTGNRSRKLKPFPPGG